MNIAIIIRTLGSGGAERVAKIIGDYYADQGNEVYYFLAKTYNRQVYQVKGKVIHTGIESSISDIVFGNPQILWKLFRSSFKLRTLKKKYKIDAAISFMEECNYLNILSKGREKVITRICTILSQEAEWTNFLYNKRMIQFFYPKADRVVVMSNYAVDDMYQNFKLPLKKMVKIPNPVLPPEQYETDTSWKYGNKVVIAVGRLASEKQQDRIIKAFSYVAAHEPETRLVILGTGPKEKYLKMVRKNYHLEERVLFEGLRNNVSYYLKNSRVFVMASLVEGFPNSMLEAMACGVPVITSDTPGGCGELIGKAKTEYICNNVKHCAYGILTPYMHGTVQIDSSLTMEEQALAQAMLAVVEDDKLYDKYSRRSLKRAAMHSMERIMPKWDRLLYQGKNYEQS